MIPPRSQWGGPADAPLVASNDAQIAVQPQSCLIYLHRCIILSPPTAFSFIKTLRLPRPGSRHSLSEKLGIKTLYASPVFEAVPGSTHGYDGINPHRINPEIGTEEDLRRISGKLREAGIGWLQDIVPNHMAFHPGNAWLMDVLEKGQASEYAGLLRHLWDVDEKLMVPFLGGTLDEVVQKGELKVTEQDGRVVLRLFRQPLSAEVF